jgi:type IV pilus assembly protein PilW
MYLKQRTRPRVGVQCQQRGVVLIEVLIAVLLLLIGLLGMASVQVRAAQSEFESYQRKQALVLLQDMVDRLQANRLRAACYALTNASTGSPFAGTGASLPGCGAGASASELVALSDMSAWSAALLGAAEMQDGNNVGAIIGARGCITDAGGGGVHSLGCVARHECYRRAARGSDLWKGSVRFRGAPAGGELEHPFRGPQLNQLQAMRNPPYLPRSRRSASRGVSLVELMIGVTLGLFIVSVMLSLLARNSEARGELEKSGRQVENGRYAMQRLAEDLRNAGFYGDFSSPVTPAAVPDKDEVCEAGTDQAGLASLKAFMGLPVQAFTEVAAGQQPSCIDDADFMPGTNVLVVRFVSPTPKLGDNWAVANLTDSTLGLITGAVYVQSNSDDMTLVRRAGGSTLVSSDGSGFTNYLKIPGPAGTLMNAPLYRSITRIYFISPCNRPAAGQTHCTAAADDDAPVPTLKMVEPLGLTLTPSPVGIAEGIERLELDYGIDTSTAGTAGAGSADSYRRCDSSDTCSPTEWSEVVSVRVSLLARTADRTAGFTDTKTYAMGEIGDISPPSDSLQFKRHAFQQVVRLNNLSMRREE